MKNFDHTSGGYLETEGAKIYFEVTGNPTGPALLLLHGGFGTVEDFNILLPNLKTYKVIGIDSRGHGKSTLGDKRLNYSLLCRDAENVLKYLNISTLSVIGFSDGGIVAYQLALLPSLKIEKLVTIGSRWCLNDALATKEIFFKITAESWKQKFPETYRTYQQLNPKPDFDKLVPLVISMWLDSGKWGYPNENISNITCSLLIVRGDNDHLTSAKSAAQLAGLVKNAMLLNIPYAGHVAYADQNAIFLIILKKFLKANQ